MAGKSIKVVISSTVVDLPDYRKAAMDACLERDIHPKMMEHLTALNAAAIKASLDLVDQADVYIGIFAHRYGYVPTEDNPLKISITEMEYNRAVEFGTPRLIFLIKENFPFDPSLVEKGSAATKLGKLKKRLGKERVVKIFTTPEDLRGHIISALVDLEKVLGPGGSVGGCTIPAPPEEYIAHPYTLLQTHHLIGRQTEMDMLTDWVSNTASDLYEEHVFSIVAIGGLGKSALTWKWFDETAPKAMKPLAGRMWWSFYDREAYFDNFVLHALAYVSDSSLEEIRKIPAPERETNLLVILNHKPYLLVLDGLERELIAYARTDASRLDDTDVDNHGNARKTTDPRVGQFLKKVTQVKCSRILISTRLQPAEFENEVDAPLPGVIKHELGSLSDDEAIEFWHSLGVQGSQHTLLDIFQTFDKHTLLIQVLAGKIKRYRQAPGDLEKWRAANPRFEPQKYSRIKDKMAHVLEFALRGLIDRMREVLNIIAAFRMPADYHTLAAIVVGEGKPCEDEDDLDEMLEELEDRGLVGWDIKANRYDLHPIVRWVVWNELKTDTRQGVYASLQAHFESVPMKENWQEVETLNDLTPAIELFYTLIGLEGYDRACDLFRDRLDKATLYRLSASRQRVDMLEQLFPDGLNEPPRLSKREARAFTLNALAQGYQFSGHPGRAAPLFRRKIKIRSEMCDDENLGMGLRNLSATLRWTGKLRESEESACRALIITRQSNDRLGEAISLYLHGLIRAIRGDVKGATSELNRSLLIRVEQKQIRGQGLVNAYLAQKSLWFEEYKEALLSADRAWDLAQTRRYEGDFIRAARVQGEAALGLADIPRAEERLDYALTRARAASLVEEEVPTLISFSRLRRLQGDQKSAREFLDDVWEYAQRGPYPLLHADALNVLAQIERDVGNTDKAIEAATKAYVLSWCDGPPYAYHWGLEKAKKHLTELEAPFPDMPEFDESKFEPMPEVEIDPEDEFHVGESSESS